MSGFFWALYDEESEEVGLEKKPWEEAGLKYPESILPVLVGLVLASFHSSQAC